MTVKEVGEKHLRIFQKMGPRGDELKGVLTNLTLTVMAHSLTHKEVTMLAQMMFETSKAVEES